MTSTFYFLLTIFYIVIPDLAPLTLFHHILFLLFLWVSGRILLSHWAFLRREVLPRFRQSEYRSRPFFLFLFLNAQQGRAPRLFSSPAFLAPLSAPKR